MSTLKGNCLYCHEKVVPQTRYEPHNFACGRLYFGVIICPKCDLRIELPDGTESLAAAKRKVFSFLKGEQDVKN